MGSSCLVKPDILLAALVSKGKKRMVSVSNFIPDQARALGQVAA